MVLINAARSQISAFLDAVHASTELQWVLAENGTEQAGENPGRKRMGELLPEGKVQKGTEPCAQQLQRASWREKSTELPFRKAAGRDAQTQPPLVQTQKLCGLQKN